MSNFVTQPENWQKIIGSKDWTDATPEARMALLIAHRQHVYDYLIQERVSLEKASAVAQKFFEDYRMNAIDNNVNPGVHASSELITGVGKAIDGISGTGRLMMQPYERIAKDQEDFYTLPEEKRAQIERNYYRLKQTDPKGLEVFKQQLYDRERIDVEEDEDGLYIDYFPNPTEAQEQYWDTGMDPTPMMGYLIQMLGQKTKDLFQSKVESRLLKNPALAESFLYSKVPQAVGNIIGQAPAAMLGGPVGLGIMGAGQSVEEGVQKARAAGATEDQIREQIYFKAGVGSLEAFGLGGFKWINKTPFGRYVETGVSRRLFGGFEEGSVEVFTQALSNAVEIYGGVAKPNRKVWEPGEMADVFLLGGLTGASMKGLEYSDKEVLLKAQKAVNKIAADSAQSVIEGNHPAIRNANRVIQSKDAPDDVKEAARQAIADATERARKLIIEAGEADAKVDEMFRVELASEAPAALESSSATTPDAPADPDAKPDLRSILSDRAATLLENATDVEFRDMWKRVPTGQQKKLRQVLGLKSNATFATIQSAIQGNLRQPVVAEPDMATGTLDEFIAYHNDLSRKRGKPVDQTVVLKEYNQLEDLVNTIASEAEVQNATQEAIAASESLTLSEDRIQGNESPDDGDPYNLTGANWRNEQRQITIAIVQGENAPLYYAREKAQAWAKQAIDDGRLSEDELRQARASLETFDPDVKSRASDTREGLLEWFSDLSVDMLAGRAITTRSLPQSVQEFFTRLTRWMTDIMRRAVRLEKAIQAGVITPQFEAKISEAAGLSVDGKNVIEGLNAKEAAAFNSIRGKSEAEVDAYLEANPETSDAVLLAYEADKRRTQEIERNAGKIDIPGEVDGADLTASVGKKPRPPKMDREGLKDAIETIDGIIARNRVAPPNRMTMRNRLDLIADTRALESILAAMPVSLRGHIGGFGTLVRMGPAARRKEIVRRGEKAQGTLERYAQGILLNDIDRLIESGAAKQSSKGKPKSTTGEAVSSQLAKIKQLIELTDAEVLAELERQEELMQTADTTKKLNDATEDYLLAVAFGNAKGKDSGALFQMVADLKTLIEGGKLQQRVIAEAFRKKVVELREEAVETITGGKGLMSSADASREADKQGSQLEKVDDFLKDMMTWDWLMNAASRKDKTTGTLKSPLNKRYGAMVDKATHDEKRQVASRLNELNKFIARQFGLDPDGKKWSWRFKLWNIHSQLQQPQDKTKVFRKEPQEKDRRVINFPVEVAREIQEGKDPVAAQTLSKDQKQYVLDALQRHDEELASVEDSLQEEIAELDRHKRLREGTKKKPSAEEQATRERFNKLSRRKENLLNQTELKDVDITDWNSIPEVEQRLSQAQAIKITLVARQEDQQANLIYWGWTPEVIEQVEKFLTPESKAIRDFLAQKYQEGWSEINDVFAPQTGARLPKIPNYSPATKLPENTFPDSMISSEVQTAGSVNPSFLISRINNKSEPNFAVDALVEYQQHVIQAAHYIHWSEPVRILSAVFGSKNVQAAIEQSGGKKLKQLILGRIKVFADGGDVGAKTIPLLDQIRKATVIKGLAWNWSQTPKQMTGALAYMYEMPVRTFLKYEREFFSDLKKNWEFMFDRGFVKARWEEGPDRDTVALLSGAFDKAPGGRLLPKSRYMQMIEDGMIFSRGGDLITTIVGGYAAYRHGYETYLAEQRELGVDVTGPAAIKAAEQAGEALLQQATERTQQGSGLKDMSTFEMGGSAARLFTTFLSNARMYYLSTWMAVGDWRAGRKGAKEEAIRRLVVGHVVLPMIFQAVVDLTKLPGLDDEEREKEFDRANMAKRYFFAMATGPFAGVYALGQGFQIGLGKALGQFVNERPNQATQSVADLIGELVSSIPKIFEDGISPEEITKISWEILSAAGSLKGNELVAIPIAGRAAKSIGIDDDIGRMLWEDDAERAGRVADERYDRLSRKMRPLSDEERMKQLLPMRERGEITEDEFSRLMELKSPRAKEPREITELRSFQISSGARAAVMAKRLEKLSPEKQQEQLEAWQQYPELLTNTVQDQISRIQAQ